MKKILITGGSGFIGKNLVEYLSPEYSVYSPSSKELDLLESEAVEKYLKTNAFDIVIHTATHNATKTSTKDITKTFEYNLRMFLNLARCNDMYDRMFCFGSAAQYHKDYLIPLTPEEYFDSHVPTTQYGFSKYCIGKYIEKLNNVCDLRLFGVFGKYEDWRIRFISQSIVRVLHNQDIKIRQDMLFDYLYIDDLLGIVKKMVDAPLQYRSYNICSSQPLLLSKIAEIILQTAKKPATKIVIQNLQIKSEFSGSNKRLLSEFPDIIFTPLKKSIEFLYRWYEKKLTELRVDELID